MIAIIWLERAINWNGWHLLNGHSENIVANIDDQIVLFTFYALNSRQFCELTVQHRKCMESHMQTHTHTQCERSWLSLAVVASVHRFLFCIYLRKMLEIRISVLYSMSTSCGRAMNKTTTMTTTTVAYLRFCNVDGYVLFILVVVCKDRTALNYFPNGIGHGLNHTAATDNIRSAVLKSNSIPWDESLHCCCRILV